MNFQLPGSALFGGATPKVGAAPRVPSLEAGDGEAARKAALMAAKRRRGFGKGTTLTSPLGDTADAPIKRKTLGA